MRRKIATILAAVFLATGSMSALCACGSDSENPGGGIEPHTHAYGEWHTTRDATCTADGERQRECTTCDDIETQAITKLGHDFETTYSADENGHYYACTRCGARDGEAEHTFINDYECSVCHWHADGTTSLGFLENEDGGYTVTGTTNDTLTKIVIPDTHNEKPVTAIAAHAFRADAKDVGKVLEEVVFGNNIKSIGYCAFGYCDKIETIVLPDSVSEIAAYAFFGCSALETLSLGDSIAEIGYGAFEECDALTYHEEGGYNYLGNAEHPKLVLVAIADPESIEGITEVTIAAETAVIMDNVFDGCSNLANVTFGENVRSIGSSAFSFCSLLEEIELPDSLRKIGNGAFMLCDALRSVSFGSGLKKIEGSAFSMCDAIQTVNIPSLAQWLEIEFVYDEDSPDASANPLNGGNALLYADGQKVTEVVIPDGVTEINAFTFAGCAELTSFTVGKDVEKIGFGVLQGCADITSLSVAAGNAAYGSETNCIYDRATMSVVLGCCNSQIPSGIKIVPAHTFEQTALSPTFVIPDSVEEIGERAFYNCGTITDLTIGTGLKRVGEWAFSSCTPFGEDTVFHIKDLAKWCEIDFADDGANPLVWESATIYASTAGGVETVINDYGTTLTIPEGVKEIKPYAFWNISTTALHLPASVEKIASTAFADNSNLTEIEVAAGNSFYEVRTCGVVEKATDTLVIGIVSGYGALTVDGVRKIGDYAFSGKAIYDEVAIGSDVKEIGAHAFDSCGITGLRLGANTETIGEAAFASNYDLTSVTVSGNVTFIGDHAFEYCGITELTLGEKVRHIGASAFASNYDLTSVIIPASVAELGGDAFSGCGLTGATFADATGWTAKNYFDEDVTPDFSDPAAVAAALTDFYTWTKNA